jgi:anti-sigma B factor antagonist
MGDPSELGFWVAVQEVGDHACVVSAGGEIDLHVARDLTRALGRAVDLGARAVAVDLSQISFIDSTGLGVLLQLRGVMNGRGGNMTVVCGGQVVRRAFRAAGLDRTFTIDRTLAEALCRLGVTATAGTTAY